MHDNAEFEVTLRPEMGGVHLGLGGLWRYRDLLLLMVWRDFSARYRQTILGPLWFLLQPLLMTLVFTVVFGRIAGLSTDGLPPLLFYLCGQLAWNYFAQNLTANSTTLSTNAGLFSKVYFPRLIVPLSAVISNLFAFLIEAATFAAFFLYFRHEPGPHRFFVDWRVVFLPLLLLQIALLSLGVGLLMSALTAKYRDLAHVTGLMVQVWMYLTPVILPLSVILRKCPAHWQWLIALNPMASVVESFRLVLLGTGTVDPAWMAVSVGMTLAILLAGLALFARVEMTFVDTV